MNKLQGISNAKIILSKISPLRGFVSCQYVITTIVSPLRGLKIRRGG
jgi:hypothetical protein